jgi:Ca-activated chloride channel homolog
VLVEVTNFMDQTLECDLEIGLQGEPMTTEPVSIGSGLSQQMVLPVPVPRPGLLEARLAIEDNLAADNDVSTKTERSFRPHVLLISDESMIADSQLQAALESDPRRVVNRFNQPPAVLPPNPVCVFYGRVPNQLPPCPTLVIDPREPCELWDVTGVIEASNSSVNTVDSASPLLADVRFHDIVVEQATRLIFKQPAIALVTSSSGDPLYSLISRPDADTLVLNVNLQKNKSDLAMRPDFPILIDNAVTWLCQDEQSATFATTTTQTISVPPSDKQRPLTTPDGLKSQLQPHQTFAALDRVGLWTGGDGAPELVLPINLLNRDESDLRAGADVSSSPLEMATEVRQPLWMLLVFVGLIGLSVEWCLFHRRIIV